MGYKMKKLIIMKKNESKVNKIDVKLLNKSIFFINGMLIFQIYFHENLINSQLALVHFTLLFLKEI